MPFPKSFLNSLAVPPSCRLSHIKYSLPILFLAIGLSLTAGLYLSSASAASPANPLQVPQTPQSGDVILAISPAQSRVTVGDTFTVAVEVNTQQPVDGASAAIDFDPTYVQVLEIVPGQTLTMSLQDTYSNEKGTIQFAAGTLNPLFPTSNFTLMTIKLVAIGETEQTAFTFRTGELLASDVTYGGISILDDVAPGSVTIKPLFPITVVPETPTPQTPTATQTPQTPQTPTPQTPTATQTPIPETATPQTPQAPADVELMALVPDQGLAGLSNEITLHGKGLRADTVVWIGGINLREFALIDPQGTRAKAVVPANLPSGTYTVTAANPGTLPFYLPDGYTVVDAGLPDLAVTDEDIWFDPLPVRQNQVTLLGVNVRRSGGEQTVSDISVAFYLDTIAIANRLGTMTLPPLEPGNNVIDVALISWTPLITGTHTVYAVVDPDNDFVEGSEANNRAAWNVTVLPPQSAVDNTPPTIQQLSVNNGEQTTTSPAVTLTISATDQGTEAASIFLVERTYNSTARQWIPLQQTGWITYTASYPMTLSPVGGVHYLQLWAADRVGNVTTTSLQTPINYLRADDSVRSGQTRLYRIRLAVGDTLTANLLSGSGDPDLYVWSPNGELAGV
ncbi:MAG: CARDB domain-containing protein, partial [Caldilinea sp.]